MSFPVIRKRGATFVSQREGEGAGRANGAAREGRFERFAAWILPIHPATGLVALFGLSLRAPEVLRGLKSQRRDLVVFGVLALIGIVSVANAYDVQRGIINFFVPFAFIWLYALGRWAIKQPTQFLVSMLYGTALLALVMVLARVFQWEFAIGDFTVLGRFSRPGQRGNVLGIPSNGLAVVLEAGVIGGLGLLLYERTWKRRLLAMAIGLLSMAGIAITLSRGAMVGIIAGTIALGFLMTPKVIVPFAGCAALLVAFFDRVRERFLSIIDLSKHTARIEIWESTLNLIRDHFWFGVGPGNFGRVYPSYAVTERVAGFGSAHNNYLFFTAQWGVLGGLTLYGWHFWVMMRSLLRGMGPHQKIMFAILVSFLTHTLFDDLMTAYAGFLLGCLENAAYERAEEAG